MQAVRIAIAASFIAFLAACASVPNAAPADTVYWGGPIYTAVDAAPRVSAVAVTDGRITFAGSRRAARAYMGAATQVVELDGAAMYPGFTDAHAHLLAIGQRERMLNLEGVASIAELKSRIISVQQHGEEAGPIVGRGWIETHWPEGRFPTAADLDEVAPNRRFISSAQASSTKNAFARFLRAATIPRAVRTTTWQTWRRWSRPIVPGRRFSRGSPTRSDSRSCT